MNEAAFPSAVDAALRRYDALPLPDGFTNRLLARLAAGDLPKDVDAAVANRTRRGSSSAWLRSGRILGSVTLFGLVTAAAAASGVLGDRIYIPVVSEMLGKTEKAPVAAKPVKIAAKPVSPPQDEPIPPATGKAAVRELWTTLRSDPEFQSLSREQRAARVKAETRLLLDAGRIEKEDVRAAVVERTAEQQQRRRERIEAAQHQLKQRAEAWRERYENASPEEQAEMLARVQKRRLEREARRRGEAMPADNAEPAQPPES